MKAVGIKPRKRRREAAAGAQSARWLPWIYCCTVGAVTPPLPVSQQPGPVRSGNRNVFMCLFVFCFSLYGFCFAGGKRSPQPFGTHHFDCRLPIISGNVEVRSGQAPDFQALQVAAGCQAVRHDTRSSLHVVKNTIKGPVSS